MEDQGSLYSTRILFYLLDLSVRAALAGLDILLSTLFFLTFEPSLSLVELLTDMLVGVLLTEQIDFGLLWKEVELRDALFRLRKLRLYRLA